MMRDDELKKVLKQWEAPGPSAKLDAKVWEAYVQNQRWSVNWKLWGAVAAGVVLVAGLQWSKPTEPLQMPGGPRLETRMAGAGFQPLEDGAVTVVKASAKR